MTKDDIIKLAREAGLFTHKEVQPELLAFAKLVAAADRKAIAQLADASVNADQYPTLTMLAQAIRMRED